MIRIENLTVSYGKKTSPVLCGVNCTVPEGKITVLIGPNGSGKSTLLKTICGFLSPQDGTVILGGKNLCEYVSGERAKKIAFLSQTRHLPELTVRHLVLHGRFPYTRFPRHYTEKDAEIVDSVLRQMKLDALSDKFLSELSGGQQQKVWLAMALAQQTPVLVLDEPLTFLDIRQQLDFLQMLKSLRNQGKTILLVVHDLHAAFTCADHLIVLGGGRVLSEGDAAVIADSGIIERAFGVRTESCVLPSGETMYAFYGSDFV